MWCKAASGTVQHADSGSSSATMQNSPVAWGQPRVTVIEKQVCFVLLAVWVASGDYTILGCGLRGGSLEILMMTLEWQYYIICPVMSELLLWAGILNLKSPKAEEPTWQACLIFIMYLRVSNQSRKEERASCFLWIRVVAPFIRRWRHYFNSSYFTT